MFEYTFADIQAQLDSLPALLRIWFGWMGFVILLMPLAFLKHRQGKIAALFTAVFVPLLLLIVHIDGITYLISFLHLALWLPLLIYLARELKTQRIVPASLFGIWAITAVETLLITLVFDFRDAIRWLAGEKGIIDPSPGIYLSWITLPAMAIALAVFNCYIFGTRKRN